MRGKRSDNWYRGRCSRITPAGAGKTNPRCVHGLSLRDHPRRCGENRDRIAKDAASVGSPPQVRGKRFFAGWVACRTGITPAGAGKTPVERADSLVQQDHPRRCGENNALQAAMSQPSGSPPQVRGKHSPPSRQRISVGITPAGAGKTFVYLSFAAMTEDHPRRCGEN